MLMPKRVKYRRVHRGRMKGKASRGNQDEERGLRSGEKTASVYKSHITLCLRLNQYQKSQNMHSA